MRNLITFCLLFTLSIVHICPVSAQFAQKTVTTTLTQKTQTQRTQIKRVYMPIAGKLRTAADGKININHASAKDFQKLLGIGPVLSGRVVAYRQKIGGRFTQKEQLIEVSGIGKKKLAIVMPFVTL
jgi:competence ComEA-like helix-hairpin-helix protein